MTTVAADDAGAFELAESAARSARERARADYAIVETSSERFNECLELPFGQADLLFEQHSLDVDVTVLRKHGDCDVRIVK